MTEARRTLRVMSYNIRFDTPRDGEHAWPNRKESVAEMVRRYRPDLLGIQEALRHQLYDLAERLPEFGWIGVGRMDGVDGGEFSPIFYRNECLELLEHGTFWLSESPDIPGSRGWDADLPRVVTWGRFQVRESGEVLYHFNTHFDHLGTRARRESAVLLAHRVQEMADTFATVMTGDFNMTERSKAYKTLASFAMDARAHTRNGVTGPKPTYHGFAPPHLLKIRIDYVFVRGPIEPLSYAALTDKWDDSYPSDHIPLLVEMEIDRQGILHMGG